MLRVQVLRDLQTTVPQTIALDVARVRLWVAVLTEEVSDRWFQATEARRPVDGWLRALESSRLAIALTKKGSESLFILPNFRAKIWDLGQCL